MFLIQNCVIHAVHSYIWFDGRCLQSNVFTPINFQRILKHINDVTIRIITNDIFHRIWQKRNMFKYFIRVILHAFMLKSQALWDCGFKKYHPYEILGCMINDCNTRWWVAKNSCSFARVFSNALICVINNLFPPNILLSAHALEYSVKVDATYCFRMQSTSNFRFVTAHDKTYSKRCVGG